MVNNAAEGRPPRVNFGWIGESFNLFQRDGGVWVAAGFIYAVAVIFLNLAFDLVFMMTGDPFVSQFGHPTGTPMSIDVFMHTTLLALVSIPLHAFFYGSYYNMANKSVRGEPLDFRDIFSGYTRIWQFVIFSFASALLGILGVLALIIGVFFMYAIIFPAGCLVADGDGVGSAISRSFNAVRYDPGSAIAITFVVWILTLFTALCILPLLVTCPMMFIISALAYRDMIGMPAAPSSLPDFDSGSAGGSWPPAPGPR